MLYSVVRIIYIGFTRDTFKSSVSSSISKYWFHERNNRDSVDVIHWMDIMNCIPGTTLRL